MRTLTQSWVRQRTSKQFLSAKIVLIATFMFALSSGCKDDVTATSTSGQISMTSQYSPSNSPSGAIGTVIPAESSTGISAVDSIKIARARFVIRDIKYKTQSDSANFRAEPFVLELNLSNAIQSMSVKGVPFGTYRKIEFDVHRINANDISSLPTSEQALFQDFLDTDRYSIIVSGTLYTAGQPVAFTFRSRINVKQKIDLSPEMIISEPSPAINATMLISSGGWFKSSSGVLLDPTDPQNENTISDNLRASIKVFKDNNKDGSKDLN